MTQHAETAEQTMTMNVHPTERYQAPVDPDYCVNCGSRPAIRVRFQQALGMVVLSQRQTFDLVLCRGCGQATGRKMTSRTLLTGWWGLAAFLWNLVGLVRNTRSLHRLGRLAAPDRAGWEPPSNPGRPVFERWTTIAFVLGVVVFTLALAL